MNQILIILADGFEEIEAVTIIDLLRRVELDVTVVGLGGLKITGSHKITVFCDAIFEDIQSNQYDYLILPGGQPGTNNLKNSPNVLDLVKNFYKQKKIIAAICAAPTVLYAAGILERKKVTSFPADKDVFNNSYYLEDNVVEDDRIITSRGVGTAIDFSLYLIEKIKGNKDRNELATRILYSG